MGIRDRIASLGRNDPSAHDGILEHYRTFWGADRVSEEPWTPEHLGSRLPDFRLVTIPPDSPDGMWTYATIGAWRATAHEDHGLEFVAVSRVPSPEVMVTLGQLAYYHAGPRENRLGVGHLVPLGEGWVPGSTLESVLVSLPYLWGPELEHCPLADRHVQVVWVLPITAAEHQFAREHGYEALEARFQEGEVNFLEPFRQSLV